MRLFFVLLCMKIFVAFILGLLLQHKLIAQHTALDTLKLTIYFNFNKSYINDAAKQTLRAIVDIDTNSYFLEKIHVNAHCDQKGGKLYNNKLSMARGYETVKYLQEFLFIEKSKLSWTPFGKDNLLHTDTAEVYRKLNRRAELFAIFSKKIVTTIKETPIIENKKETVNESFTTNELPTSFAAKVLDSSFKAGDTVRLNNILFQPGRHQFLAISNTQLMELFNAMKDIQTLQIEIHGHICCNLSKDDALDYETGKFDLSFQRAKAVFDYLVARGNHPKRMSYKGFGHQFPLNEEKTSFEMQQNRRVEIKVISK